MDFSGRERDKLFRSDAGNGFEDISYLYGLDAIEDGRGFALADLDRDGRDEILLVNRNAPVLRIYTRGARPGSPGAGHHSIGVKVTGDGVQSNADAVGAQVTAHCSDRQVMRHVALGEGFAVQNSSVLRLGLGECATITKLVVSWPSGRVRSFQNVTTDRDYEVSETGPLRPMTVDRRPFAAGSTARLFDTLGDTLGTLNIIGSDGDSGSWTSDRGLIYVDLFASWCQACKAAIPKKRALAQRFADDVQFVSVSVEPTDTAGVLASYVKAHHPGYPFALARTEAQAAAVAQLRERFGGNDSPLPAGMLFDRQGNLLWSGLGTISASDLIRIVATHASHPAAAQSDSPRWLNYLARLFALILGAASVSIFVIELVRRRRGRPRADNTAVPPRTHEAS
jgi:thiol-disulfide isomerase/thioredoxin